MDLKGHSDIVDAVSWHPTSDSLFASASSDKSIRIWDTKSGKQVKSEKTKEGNINLAWNPNGMILGVGNTEEVINFYDFRTWKHLQQINIKSKVVVNEFAWDKTGQMLFVTSEAGQVFVFNGKTLAKQPINSMDFHSVGCFCISVDPTNERFATGSADSLIALWDLAEMQVVNVISTCEFKVQQVGYSHDGKFLAAGGEDDKSKYSVNVYDSFSGEQLYAYSTSQPKHTLAWHPKKQILAYAGEEKGEGSIHLLCPPA